MLWSTTATLLAIALFSLPYCTWAFIPAQAVNVSESSTLDVHDDSQLTLTWSPNGSYTTSISYQQAGNGSMGISKGALIRVQEEDIWNNDTTITPWIALIGCDKNATNQSMEVDIFTMVRDRGALAALLYSNTSDGCEVNRQYLDSGEFDHIFDIFTAKKATTAILIQSQYANIDYSCSLFNPLLLNQSYNAVAAALPRSAQNESPYVVATLRAANATGEEDPNDPAPIPTISPSTEGENQNDGGDGSQKLAMIILYIIVSLVSSLFIVVVLSGAIRAFRHPERYGPRLYDPTLEGEENYPQTRAAGITKAILDTFPVVKFGRTDPVNDHRNARFEMKVWDSDKMNHPRSSAEVLAHQRNMSPASLSESRQQTTPHARSSRDSSVKQLPLRDSAVAGTRGQNVAAEAQKDQFDPASIGKETCPICIIDFEDGDDLRVLPCEGHHRFHKDCVDPWLLELSTSCPICREDFQRLETIAVASTEESGGEEEREQQDRFASQTSIPTQSNRFSRYLRFAQRRRNQRDGTTSEPAQNSAGPYPA